MSENLSHQKLRTPRAAAVAGIIFSLLLSTSIIIIRYVSQARTTTQFDKETVILALNLVPFAGIAFLWFIGVVRDRIGQFEDRFFATVFLGSGLLFLAMLFTTAAIAGGAVAVAQDTSDQLVVFSKQITATIMNFYAMKMAAVFMISTSTIMLRTSILSRWLAYSGYALALIQLVAITLWEWVVLLFPLWIFVLSIEILMRNPRAKRE